MSHETAGAPAPERRAWTRNHFIWLLMALSLVPGAVAALIPEHWAAVHPVAQLTAYGLSGLLIVVCVVLIMTARN